MTSKRIIKRANVGMTFEEASGGMGISVPTAKRWRAYSRAGLTVEL